MSSTTLTQKGQVTIPKWIRDKFGFKPGEKLLFKEKNNTIVVEKAPTLENMFGFIKTDKVITQEDMDRAIKKGYIESYKKSLTNSK